MSQPLIKQLIQNYDAPINECNYPCYFRKLRMDTKSICRRMLCRLRIRPFGRNVMGGRKAAKRIEQAFLKTTNNIV